MELRVHFMIMKVPPRSFSPIVIPHVCYAQLGLVIQEELTVYCQKNCVMAILC